MECDCSKDIKQLEDRLKIYSKNYSDLYNEFNKHIENLIKEYMHFEHTKSRYDNLFSYGLLIMFTNSLLIIGLIYKVMFA
jgi:hypothetical protein